MPGVNSSEMSRLLSKHLMASLTAKQFQSLSHQQSRIHSIRTAPAQSHATTETAEATQCGLSLQSMVAWFGCSPATYSAAQHSTYFMCGQQYVANKATGGPARAQAGPGWPFARLPEGKEAWARRERPPPRFLSLEGLRSRRSCSIWGSLGVPGCRSSSMLSICAAMSTIYSTLVIVHGICI